MDESMHLGGNAFKTPQRKKSMHRMAVAQALLVNDDDAERMARRQSININNVSTPTSNSPNDTRRSLGLSALAAISVQQMTERMSECIKLNAQNKINVKNAFSLEMIDFMTYLIKKQDHNMSDLQMATTSLDVSTKIYGFRVDGVHAEALRMMGLRDKQDKSVDGKSKIEQSQDQDQGTDGQEAHGKKKKKKRNKHHILATHDSLKGVIEIQKPSILAIGQTDVQTTDSLNQAILPLISSSAYYLQPHIDVILDTVSGEQLPDIDRKCSIPTIDDFTDMEICPALSNFNFLNESLDDSGDLEQEDQTNPENRFRFDLDASLPGNDDHVESTMNYFDMENTHDRVEEQVDLCAPAGRQVENIVDFQSILSSTVITKPSEYTFIPKSLNIHWAGPSHWKINAFGKPVTGNSIETRALHGPNRKRKVLELQYDLDILNSVKCKFGTGHATKLQFATTKTVWTEEKVLLPIDMKYDVEDAFRCYLHPKRINLCNDESKEESAGMGDMDDHCDYSNDISNDAADIHVDDFQANDQNNAKADNLIGNSQIPFTNENLVAVPKLACKSAIAYSSRAKKVDMRELKHTIWNTLTKSSEIQDINMNGTSRQETLETSVQGIEFNRVYKKLPGQLSKTNAEALSFPISFVSLLHLANEKSLTITVLPDLSDVIVKK